MNDVVLFRMQVDVMLDRLKNSKVEKEVKAQIEEIKALTRLEVLGLDLVGKIIYDTLKNQEC